MSSFIVWVDCEMTGLEVGVDEICEIAVIVTDEDLNPVHEGFQVVVKPSRKAMKNMGEFVTNMHTVSGLITEIPKGISIKKAEQQVLDYVKQWVTDKGTAPLAGNSIGTDRMFLNRQTPEFDSFLHYRNIDVSSFKEMARRWYPKIYFQLPKKRRQSSSAFRHSRVNHGASLLPQSISSSGTGAFGEGTKGSSFSSGD